MKKYLFLALLPLLLIPVFAQEFTMFGNTFHEDSECADYGLKYFQAIAEKPYNLDQVQPQMMIAEKRCDPNP